VYVRTQSRGRNRPLRTLTAASARVTTGRLGRHRRSRGQSLAEFALVLPVMLALLGMGVDFARLFFQWIDLEAATRDAAQYVASDPAFGTTGGYYDLSDSTNYCSTYPCSSAPSTDAKTVLDAATGRAFTKSSSQTDCTTPKVWASLASPDTSASSGGNSKNPISKAQVTACIPFRMYVSYPWLKNGTWVVRTDRTVSTIVGR
jgi:Flp pilus assembly protein TadG